MKKLIVCALAGVMVLSLAACSNSESKEAEEKTTGEQGTASSEAEKAQEAEEAVEGQETDDAVEAQEAGETVEAQEAEESVGRQSEEVVDGDKSEAAGEEASGQESVETADAPDVSASVDGAATSESAAVPFGSWVKTAMYAAQDDSFHTVYVRLMKVTTQSADAAYVEAAIETNDTFAEEEGVFDADTLEVPADGELVVLDYEVYVPEDFPAASYGMPAPRFYFSIRNIGGGGIPSTDGSESYVGLGTTVDLVTQDPEEAYQPGHIYEERCIFAMVKGYTNYVAVYSTYPDGTSGEEADIDNLYTVYHAVK